ncbi:MAG: hypothetical protein K6U14_09350 [Firmicutes bacterium]|nr:hypothetical protein [Alicyclobacillaceae bacterium]MCL6497817.1 hypothetical protein [Bacillota bacterium]
MAAAVGLVLAACGNPDPHRIADMPPPVRAVAESPSPSGMTLADAMLTVTGNLNLVGSGTLPGSYLYGPSQADPTRFRVEFFIPLNFDGIARRMGYRPKPHPSVSLPGEEYLYITPLPNQAFDKLYFNPTTNEAEFDFVLTPSGQVLDRSWAAVAVNS